MSGGRVVFEMRRAVVESLPDRRVVAVDTIAHVAAEDAGQIVVAGSHGGISSGEYAGRVALAVVFFNDAGIGKDQAGVAGLGYLEDLGIAAGAVSHESAVIGDAFETWEYGAISVVNDVARATGFLPGEPLCRALRRIYGGAQA